MEKNSPKLQTSLAIGILGCFGGLLIQVVIGALYVWGIINIYMTSYYHLTDPGLTLQSTGLVFPLMMASIGITMRLGLHLAKITHPVIVMTIGQILQALSIFVASFMPSIWTFILFFGIVFGLIAGNSFMIPIDQCNRYLVGRKMIVNGIILVGTGLGPVVFGLFSYNFLNPNRVSPLNGYYSGTQELEDIANKCPVLIKWLSLIYLGIGLLGVSMITPVCLHNRRVQNYKQRQRKQQQAQNPAINQQPKENKEVHLPNPIESHQVLAVSHMDDQTHIEHKHEAQSIVQAIKSRIFWISLLILFLAPCGCFLISGNYKTYVKTKIKDDEFLTYIGVVAAVGNGVSRFLWSLYFSKTGYKTVLLTILTIAIATLSTIRFSSQYKQSYLISVLLINTCLGGFMVSAPTMAQSLYGHATGSNIYAIYWENYAFSNMLGYIFVSQLSKKIGFDNTIYVCLSMAAVAVPLVLRTRYQGPWVNDTMNLEYCLGIEMEKSKHLQISTATNSSEGQENRQKKKEGQKNAEPKKRKNRSDKSDNKHQKCMDESMFIEIHLEPHHHQSQHNQSDHTHSAHHIDKVELNYPQVREVKKSAQVQQKG